MPSRLTAFPILAAAALALPGCCAIFCRTEPPESPPRHTRDTPAEAVDYLVDAVQNRRIREVYDTLDPDFVRENGDFSAADFLSGYERVEDSLRADASRISQAERRPPEMRDGLAWVRVELDDMSAWLVFRNRPVSEVKVEDPDFGRFVIPAPFPGLSEALEADAEGLRVTRPAGTAGRTVEPAQVVRVAYHDDWLLRHVVEPRNVRFVDELRELSQ